MAEYPVRTPQSTGERINSPANHPPRKLLHIEFMRILAVYAVMFNHTGINGFFHFSVVTTRIQRWGYLPLSIGCKFAVPLFFMISGAVLLRKEEPASVVFRKRIPKILRALLLASLFYWLYFDGDPAYKLNPGNFLRGVYTGRISVTLWYLYSYLAMLLMLPLLRKLVRVMEQRDFWYLAVVQLIFTGLIPIADYLLFHGEYGINGNLRPALFTAVNITYVLMGYYFEYLLPDRFKTTRTVLLAAGASLASIAVCSVMTLYRYRFTGDLSEANAQTFHSSLIAIPTYTIYLACKLLFERVTVPEKLRSFITTVGGATFGIYLLDEMLRTETRPIFEFLQPRIGTMPGCFLRLLCAFSLGSLLVWILKKLPVLKEIL